MTDILPLSVRRTRREKLGATVRLLLSVGWRKSIGIRRFAQTRPPLSAPVYQFVLLINRRVPTVLAWERLSALGEHWFLRNEEVGESTFNFGMKKRRVAFWTSQDPASHERIPELSLTGQDHTAMSGEIRLYRK